MQAKGLHFILVCIVSEILIFEERIKELSTAHLCATQKESPVTTSTSTSPLAPPSPSKNQTIQYVNGVIPENFTFAAMIPVKTP